MAHLGRRWWMMAAAMLLACCSLVAYQLLCPPLGLCRYVTACTAEHQRVLSAAVPTVLSSSDPVELSRYAARAGAPWEAEAGLPELAGHRLVGAGKAPFVELRSVGAPEAVFIRYADAAGRPLLLFAQSWGAETPTVERLEYDGRPYWFAVYGGVGYVGWKTPDGRVLCSLTGDRPRAELLRLAASVRGHLERRSPP